MGEWYFATLPGLTDSVECPSVQVLQQAHDLSRFDAPQAIISQIAAAAASLPTGCRRTRRSIARRMGVAVTGSPAVMLPSREPSTLTTGALEVMESDREHLTHLLRRLASRLDELDRRLADLAWRQHRPHTGAHFGETVCERTALESEWERLTDRLGVLAQRLNTLDSNLSGVNSDHPPAAPVGTCPYCGYPSLGSGLCAFCRPHLVR
jgi:hypothetical protein